MKKIRLFWWNEVYYMGKPLQNYGDLLGKYLVEKISNKEVEFVNPRKWHLKDYFQPIYATAGSILAHVNRHCVVWGSGIILKDQVVKPARFLAVRGPQTSKRLLEQGYKVPEIYGDPALLLPLYYNPPIEKKYTLGIVPHYNDFKAVQQNYQNRKDLLIIDLMTNDIEATTNLFLSCERIVSSSLHGLIVAHAYGIPAVWVQFSDKLFGDGIKFRDYFESVKLPTYQPEVSEQLPSIEELKRLLDTFPSLPEQKTISQLQKGLMDVCPFVEKMTLDGDRK
ncbi:polysaccharide pyruvyl transferase family protein [uncultured Planktosalinus sp.]|uniref:polysaccharide pyruvyl transferase family protein n=1 Tax=uncultured Planktosalinus sp. TaxID=1810935 RepID=UPI0030D7181B